MAKKKQDYFPKGIESKAKSTYRLQKLKETASNVGNALKQRGGVASSKGKAKAFEVLQNIGKKPKKSKSEYVYKAPTAKVSYLEEVKQAALNPKNVNIIEGTTDRVGYSNFSVLADREQFPILSRYDHPVLSRQGYPVLENNPDNIPILRGRRVE